MSNISHSHNKIIIVPKNQSQSSFKLPNIYAISVKIPSRMSTCQLPHFRSSPLSDRGLSLVSGAGRGFCGRGAANLSSFQEWSGATFCLTKFFCFFGGFHSFFFSDINNFKKSILEKRFDHFHTKTLKFWVEFWSDPWLHRAHPSDPLSVVVPCLPAADLGWDTGGGISPKLYNVNV